MDGDKEERKKESIDDILSDLNGLLNKMPSILDGIKLPEVTQAEPPVQAVSSVPENQPEKNGIADLDKTIKIDAPVIMPAAAPAQDKLVPQSLGEHLFSQESGPAAAVPGPRTKIQPEPLAFQMESAALESAPEMPEIKLFQEKSAEEPSGEPAADSVAEPVGEPAPEPLELSAVPEEQGPVQGSVPADVPVPLRMEPASPAPAPEPEEIEPVIEPAPGPGAIPAEAENMEPAMEKPSSDDPVFDLDSLKAEEAAAENALRPEPENDEEEVKVVSSYEATKDFGVPDIDALMRLSSDDGAQRTGTPPSPVVEPPVQEADDTVAAIVPEADIQMPAGSFDKAEEVPPLTEPASGQLAEPEAVPSPVLEMNIGTPADMPALPADDVNIAQITAPAPDKEGGIMELKDEGAGKEGIFKPEDVLGETLPGSPASADAEAPAAPETPGPALELSMPQEFTLKTNEPASQETAPSDAGAAPEMEQIGAVFNTPTVPAGDEDKTMVAAPSSGADAEKTVIYSAGAASPASSGGRTEIGGLGSVAPPENIPAERVRSLAFVYAREDEGLCADMLAELDAICLRSPSKPMFIKRAFVQVCEASDSGPVIMQKVADAAACGLICVGGVPQENVYEIENVFTAGGVFFRHITRENFNHSAALDIVAELILK